MQKLFEVLTGGAGAVLLYAAVVICLLVIGWVLKVTLGF